MLVLPMKRVALSIGLSAVMLIGIGAEAGGTGVAAAATGCNWNGRECEGRLVEPEINKRQAARAARVAFHKRYNAAGRVSVSCVPRGWDEPVLAGVRTHKWECWWSDDGDDSYGAFVVTAKSTGGTLVKMLAGVHYAS
jgi:hypothetical protein